MAATHSEYGASTTATEVAAAFADQIKGKNGKLKIPMTVYFLLLLTL